MTGDLWAFLRAVDNDYKTFLREREAEEENAAHFITHVIRERTAHEERQLQVCHDHHS